MPGETTSESDALCVIPAAVLEKATRGVGAFFEPIARIDRARLARDFLDASKSLQRARTVERFAPLAGARVLEVGSGYGTNLVVWLKHLGVDVRGAEPAGVGFDSALAISREVLAANGCDPARVVEAAAEALPFPDESFDVVYSSNVLEHTTDPRAALTESVRVLRRGGTLQFEVPNFLSYFEGHYMVLQPPLVSRHVLPLWVRYAYGRDPAYARTLRTEINPIWCRRVVRELSARYPVALLSLGEEIFLERLAHAFAFEMRAVAGKLGPVVAAVQRLNYRNWLGRAIVAAQGHYPIHLTLRKL